MQVGTRWKAPRLLVPAEALRHPGRLIAAMRSTSPGEKTRQRLGLLFAAPGLILMSIWGAGGGMVIYLAALQDVPEQLYEAASLDGAGRLAQFRHVTLPMLSPVILFNLIMGLIGTFQYFTQAFVMTHGGPEDATTFYALHLF